MENLYVVKRDDRIQEFDKEKIINAICGAFLSVDGEITDYALTKAQNIAKAIEEKVANGEFSEIEDIQDEVEAGLCRTKRKDIAKHYILYRNQRNEARGNLIDKTAQEMLLGSNEYWMRENSNKDATNAITQRDYMAGILSTDIARRLILPEKIKDAHDKGIIHVHDMDYMAQTIFNCCLINLDDMLQNGTMINKTKIDKPHSFSTACTIATQIMAVVASGQYGGQSVSIAHLAPFVEESRKRIKIEVEKEAVILGCTRAEKINEIIENRVKKEIERGVQTMQYQINTLNTSNGQTPFCTLCLYLGECKDEKTKDDLALIIEEILKQRIVGVKNEVGVYVTPAFPKLVYVLEEDNIHPDSKYYWLTELAAKCSAKRLVPDYVSEKIMKRDKINGNHVGDCYPPMGCRSFLLPDTSGNGWNNMANALNYDPKEPKYYGRFNCGVVTINLIDAACSAKTEEDFWKILDERIELCHQALLIRHKRLRGVVSDISPIHFQYGAIARLKQGETIDKLLYNNYSTISLGYAGLWECVYKLIGKKLTEPEGFELGKKIMQKLNDKTKEWKEKEHIGYSVYGTPIESVTYKFAKCLKERFGIIEGVTDKNYITNSYHIKVTEPIDAFSKLTLEAKLQTLSPGGAISYIETSNLQNNIPAVLSVIKFIYNNIMYAELNTKSDYCQKCGFDGEIQIVEDENGHNVWECPNCHNRDQKKINVARRTCGLI